MTAPASPASPHTSTGNLDLDATRQGPTEIKDPASDTLVVSIQKTF